MNPISILGGALVALGILSFAVPMFTTSQTRDVANIGDLKIQTTENRSYAIPPLASGAAVVVGVALLGFGMTRRRG